ncbi:MAG: hypothetical protein KKA79_05925, partial [Nanoarchaeota archaeon]|nr:hypothetical protein [Nanoarchaeota archaeon]
MVKIWSNIPFRVKVSGIIIGSIYTVILAANYVFSHNERNYSSYYGDSVIKIDGALSSTKYVIKDERYANISLEHKVHKSRVYWRDVAYYDGGYKGKLDGKVDAIKFGEYPLRVGEKKSLTRKRDYEKHKELFDEADKILAKEKI